MSKELEEAIKYFEKISKEWKTMGNTQIEAAKKLEIILQALKNSIPKEAIENKTKELKEKANEYEENMKNDIHNFWHNEFLKICHKIHGLQELLEENK